MGIIDTVCLYIADIVPLLFSVSAFAYGAKNFFKKGKALYLQSIVLAIGCHALGNFYHLCQTVTTGGIVDGFTAAYLGRMGFFLFLFTANFGQINGLIDDRTPKMAKYRYIAFLAPIAVAALFIPALLSSSPISTKISMGLVWICAMFSSYYNFKHAIISDDGFGFVKAIRPYNISALALTVNELIILLFLTYYPTPAVSILMALFSVIFGITGVITVIMLKRGVEAWKI